MTLFKKISLLWILVLLVTAKFSMARDSQNSIRIQNASEFPVDVYFQAIGCFGVEDGFWTVCQKLTLEPNSQYIYTPGLFQTFFQVTMRPQDLTNIVIDKDMTSTGFGKFAEDWFNAFKKTVKGGPKGLLGFVQAFKSLYKIKNQVDRMHMTAKTFRNVRRGQTVTFFGYDATFIRNRLNEAMMESEI